VTLLAPLRFLAIRHRFWWRYNIVLPALGASATVALSLLWPDFGAAFGKEGLLAQLQNPLAILGGFFVAALTLITTDRSNTLSNKVGGQSPPRMTGEVEGLSRRRFLAYLFGYLSFSSFALVILVMIGNALAPGAKSLLRGDLLPYVRSAILFGVTFWVAHVIVATMLGLYYFTERLQLSEGAPKAGSPNSRPTPAE
jgi:hypothetical protein